MMNSSDGAGLLVKISVDSQALHSPPGSKVLLGFKHTEAMKQAPFLS
jgi:hypothetical protein